MRQDEYIKSASLHGERWLQLSACTDPVDPAEMKTAVGRIYDLSGLQPPELIICQSPWQMAVLSVLIELSLQIDWTRSTRFFSELKKLDAHNPCWVNSIDRLAVTLDFKLANKLKLRQDSFAARMDPTVWLSANEFPTLGKLLRDELDATRSKVITSWRRTQAKSVFAAKILMYTDTDLVARLTRRAVNLSIVEYLHRIKLRKVATAFGLHPKASETVAQFCEANRRWAPGDRMSFAAFLAAHPALISCPPYVIEKCKWLGALHSAVPAYSFYSNVALVSDRPISISIDSPLRRLHHESGPAIKYSDEFAQYHWHGLNVPASVIENPELITPKAIDKEANVEVRRVMLARYGEARYIVDSKAKLIAKDNFGELYCKTHRSDESLVMVRVVNSTPEPDGTKKHYWLRVPPFITSARAGVAWTFGLDAAEYDPDEQT